MSFARRSLVVLATTAFVILLYLSVMATAGAVIFKSGNVKSWLKDSGAYQKFVDAAIKSIPQENTASQSEQNLFSQPAVQNIAKTAFTPQLLESSTENFIDGTFTWLEGKSTKPTFNIDLSGAKQSFANGIGTYAQDRYNALPVCARGQVPDTSDILAISCRVPGVNITPIINQKVQEIANSKEFIGTPVVTADNFNGQEQLGTGSQNNQAAQEPFYEQASQLPKLYRFSKIAPYIFIGLAILVAVAIVFVSTTKRSGLKRIAIPLLIAAGLLFIGIMMTNFSLGKLEQTKISDTNAMSALAQTTGITIANSIGKQLNQIYLWFGIAFALLGGGILAALYFTKPKNEPAKEGKKESVKAPKPELATAEVKNKPTKLN